MLKMASESFILTLLMSRFLGLFLKISRWVPLMSLVSLTDSDTAIARGGDSHMKQTGMLVGNFEFNP